MSRVVCGLAVAALVVAVLGGTASARPPYVGAFKGAYPNVKIENNANCAVCHIGKPADKKWNDYGTAMKKALGKEKASADEATAALKKIEGEKSGTEGKTFGDLLKDGKLPGKG
ncbi:MAG: hypothetical protein IT428_08860 [Planctomycetaceae bacterium]|nr:hypothetical protein [Planctomycetaceae bacterium]